MNEQGFGMPVDGKQAIIWFTKAVEKGNTQAQWNLGRIYFEGTVVKRDPVQGYMYLKIASDRGNVMAKRLLEEYVNGKALTSEQVAEGDRRVKENEAKNPAKTSVDAASDATLTPSPSPGQNLPGH